MRTIVKGNCTLGSSEPRSPSHNQRGPKEGDRNCTRRTRFPPGRNRAGSPWPTAMYILGIHTRAFLDGIGGTVRLVRGRERWERRGDLRPTLQGGVGGPGTPSLAPPLLVMRENPRESDPESPGVCRITDYQLLRLDKNWLTPCWDCTPLYGGDLKTPAFHPSGHTEVPLSTRYSLSLCRNC